MSDMFCGRCGCPITEDQRSERHLVCGLPSRFPGDGYGPPQHENPLDCVDGLLLNLDVSRGLFAGMNGSISGLLAVIHRDGGHHTDAVGLAQSVEEAKARYYALHEEIERLRTGMRIEASDVDRPNLPPGWRLECGNNYTRPNRCAIGPCASDGGCLVPVQADAEQATIAAWDYARREECCGMDWVEYAEALERRAEDSRAEVARLRPRVQVEAGDIERAGVTWAQVCAWRDTRGVGSSMPERMSGSLAWYINQQAAALRCPALDILDAMIAMEIP